MLVQLVRASASAQRLVAKARLTMPRARLYCPRLRVAVPLIYGKGVCIIWKGVYASYGGGSMHHMGGLCFIIPSHHHQRTSAVTCPTHAMHIFASTRTALPHRSVRRRAPASPRRSIRRTFVIGGLCIVWKGLYASYRRDLCIILRGSMHRIEGIYASYRGGLCII